MKQIVLLLSLLAFVSAFNGNVFAQATASVSADATVLANINAATAQNINFANIDPELDPTPTLDVDAYSASNVSGSPTFGLIDISGSDTQTISVTWNDGTGTVSLNDGSSNTMDLVITAAYTNEASGSVTAGGTTVISNNGDTITLDSDGGTVVLGGTLSNPSSSTLPAGTYNTSFNVEFDYTF